MSKGLLCSLCGGNLERIPRQQIGSELVDFVCEKSCNWSAAVHYFSEDFITKKQDEIAKNRREVFEKNIMRHESHDSVPDVED